MLDAYIIERIRRERERESERDGALVPLRIEVPEIPEDIQPPAAKRKEEDEDRGSVVIDFNL